MKKNTVIVKTFDEVCKPVSQFGGGQYDYTKDAIINDEFPGFREDYLVLHSLIKTYFGADPKHPHYCQSVFEIGTNMGTGTNIICNAAGKGVTVYSLDLPTELAHTSLQHPISEGKGDCVGHRCKLPYTQLRGDSMTFDFGEYPADIYFVDGEHDATHVQHETREILKNKPVLVVYHDADIAEVMAGIIAGMKSAKHYDLYRVEGTRIAYLLRQAWPKNEKS